MQKNKRVVFSPQASDIILSGVDKVCDAVKTTMGASGRNVILSDGRVTKDGVSVARDIHLEDEAERLVSQIVQQAAMKTNQEAGDGTTTVCVLTQALVHNAMRHIKLGSLDVQEIRSDMESAADEIKEFLTSNAIQIKNDAELERIASISANDADTGKLVAGVVKETGKDGYVVIERNPGIDTVTEIVNGMRIDKGWVAPHFCTDNARGEASYEDARVLVYGGRLDDVRSLVALLEKLVKDAQPIVIFAEEFDPMILQTLIANRVQNGLKTLPIQLPFISREEVMEDIATYCGATVIGSNTSAYSLKSDNVLEAVGVVKSILASRDTTVIEAAASEGVQERILDRVGFIREEMKEYSGDKLTELKQRISRLEGKIGIIRAGGKTDAEINERRDRIEDAVHATMAAIEGGYISGGGMALIQAYNSWEGKTLNLGTEIVLQSILEPFKQIVRNAGLVDDAGEVNIALHKALTEGKGYDARNKEHCDVLEAGIIDPVRVTIKALENAISVATMLITTNAINYAVDSDTN